MAARARCRRRRGGDRPGLVATSKNGTATALESPYSPPANRPGNRYTSEPAAAGGEDSGLESAARGQPQEEVADFAADGSHRHTEGTGDGLVFEAVAQGFEGEEVLRADRARPAVDVG